MKLGFIQKGCVVLLILTALVGFIYLFISQDKKADKETLRIGVVVPHHDIKKNLRLELWGKICSDFDCASVERVIILSPNHFDANQQRIIYTTKDWTTHKGQKKNFLHDLVGAEIDNGKTREDHGVVNLLAEIVSNFPNADVGAVLIGNKVEFKKLEYLVEKIKEICEESCVVVASVDFSHEVAEKQAKKQDMRTIDFLIKGNLKDGSLSTFPNVTEVDSPQALYILQEFGKNFGKKFEPSRRTSSNEQDENTLVTSHVFGIWK